MMNNNMMNPMRMMNPMMPPMGMGMPFLPNYGLGPNDSMNMFNSMLNIFNNNSFSNRPTSTGYYPGIRTPAPSPFIFEDRERNMNLMNMMNMNPMNMNNMNMINMNNMMMNMNMFMNNFNNMNMNNNIFNDFSNLSLDKKDVKRDENLDVKMDIDNLLKTKNGIDNKNKDIQYILNYIPFTVIKDIQNQQGMNHIV